MAWAKIIYAKNKEMAKKEAIMSSRGSIFTGITTLKPATKKEVGKYQVTFVDSSKFKRGIKAEEKRYTKEYHKRNK
jgi:hypothetical protein